MNMNDIVVNKRDELKYLILMKENFRKYKLKTNYFLKWKKSVSINENSINIQGNDSFENNIRMNYNLFKSMNNLSSYPKLKAININRRSNSLFRYNNNESYYENESIEKRNIKKVNNWKNSLIVYKNKSFKLVGSFNKNKIQNLEIEEYHFNINRALKKDLDNIKNNKELNISKLEIEFKHQNQKCKVNNSLKIIKNNEFKIFNRHNRENKNYRIIENGLINGQEHTYKYVEKNDLNNKQILRNINKNKNIKNIKNKNNISYQQSSNDNTIKEDSQFFVNLLIIVFLIIIGSLIINELNIDNF